MRTLQHTRNGILQSIGGLLQQTQASEGIMYPDRQALRGLHSAPKLCTSAIMETNSEHTSDNSCIVFALLMASLGTEGLLCCSLLVSFCFLVRCGGCCALPPFFLLCCCCTLELLFLFCLS